ncbi:hypothetical protein Pmani_004453 [Petrolisthes manimaculis]|uniref:Uncharacterized protein n=1 Tax=Petrolisthes manimaculis TaxID=1843537 RepID=A0AAE1QGU9_9EUCA|nr:hypothetical protein Pmani_004453 [Petrolisthes manimaculis]
MTGKISLRLTNLTDFSNGFLVNNRVVVVIGWWEQATDWECDTGGVTLCPLHTASQQHENEEGQRKLKSRLKLNPPLPLPLLPTITPSTPHYHSLYSPLPLPLLPTITPYSLSPL